MQYNDGVAFIFDSPEPIIRGLQEIVAKYVSPVQVQHNHHVMIYRARSPLARMRQDHAVAEISAFMVGRPYSPLDSAAEVQV